MPPSGSWPEFWKTSFTIRATCVAFENFSWYVFICAVEPPNFERSKPPIPPGAAPVSPPVAPPPKPEKPPKPPRVFPPRFACGFALTTRKLPSFLISKFRRPNAEFSIAKASLRFCGFGLCIESPPTRAGSLRMATPLASEKTFRTASTLALRKSSLTVVFAFSLKFSHGCFVAPMSAK